MAAVIGPQAGRRRTVRRDLIGTSLVIEQKTPQAFNLDTILLSWFARIPPKARHVLDVGTGNGAVMLYLSAKTKARITGIEIQDHLVAEARTNIALNGLEERLSVIKGDVRTADLPCVSVVVSNPPFFKVVAEDRLSRDPARMIARHEVTLTLEDVIGAAARALGDGGIFYMIHRPDRMEETLRLLALHGFSAKRLMTVHPYRNHKANHVLYRADKGGKEGLIIDAPLVLYKDKGVPSDDMITIYGGTDHASDAAFTQGKTEIS
jgi:tRNA1Val (adenine37-N6)-methyltransferase